MPRHGGGRDGGEHVVRAALPPGARVTSPAAAGEGLGHLGLAAAPGLDPFGRDVFNAGRLGGWDY